MAVQYTPVSVNLNINVDTQHSVTIFEDVPAEINNIIKCKTKLPVSHFYNSGDIDEALFEFQGRDNDIIGRVIDNFAISQRNQSLNDSLESILTDETNDFDQLNATNAVPFNILNKYTNDNYKKYKSIGNLVLAIYAHYLFGHVQATAAIVNDTYIIDYMNGASETDAKIISSLVNAIYDMDELAATKVCKQVIGQDASRTRDVDNDLSSPASWQRLQWKTGDIIYVQVTILPPTSVTVGDGLADIQKYIPQATEIPLTGIKYNFEIELVEDIVYSLNGNVSTFYNIAANDPDTTSTTITLLPSYVGRGSVIWESTDPNVASITTNPENINEVLVTATNFGYASIRAIIDGKIYTYPISVMRRLTTDFNQTTIYGLNTLDITLEPAATESDTVVWTIDNTKFNQTYFDNQSANINAKTVNAIDYTNATTVSVSVNGLTYSIILSIVPTVRPIETEINTIPINNKTVYTIGDMLQLNVLNYYPPNMLPQDFNFYFRKPDGQLTINPQGAGDYDTYATISLDQVGTWQFYIVHNNNNTSLGGLYAWEDLSKFSRKWIAQVYDVDESPQYVITTETTLLEVGNTFTVTLSPAYEGEGVVTWSSTNSNVLSVTTIDNNTASIEVIGYDATPTIITAEVDGITYTKIINAAPVYKIVAPINNLNGTNQTTTMKLWPSYTGTDNITWSTNDATLYTVTKINNNTAQITSLKEGLGTITATLNGTTYSKDLSAIPYSIKQLGLFQQIGSVINLSLTPNYVGINPIQWESSDPSIIKVLDNGINQIGIQKTGFGTATITCTIENENIVLTKTIVTTELYNNNNTSEIYYLNSNLNVYLEPTIASLGTVTWSTNEPSVYTVTKVSDTQATINTKAYSNTAAVTATVNGNTYSLVIPVKQFNHITSASLQFYGLNASDDQNATLIPISDSFTHQIRMTDILPVNANPQAFEFLYDPSILELIVFDTYAYIRGKQPGYTEIEVVQDFGTFNRKWAVRVIADGQTPAYTIESDLNTLTGGGTVANLSLSPAYTGAGSVTWSVVNPTSTTILTINKIDNNNAQVLLRGFNSSQSYITATIDENVYIKHIPIINDGTGNAFSNRLFVAENNDYSVIAPAGASRIFTLSPAYTGNGNVVFLFGSSTSHATIEKIDNNTVRVTCTTTSYLSPINLTFRATLFGIIFGSRTIGVNARKIIADQTSLTGGGTVINLSLSPAYTQDASNITWTVNNQSLLRITKIDNNNAQAVVIGYSATAPIITATLNRIPVGAAWTLQLLMVNDGNNNAFSRTLVPENNDTSIITPINASRLYSFSVPYTGNGTVIFTSSDPSAASVEKVDNNTVRVTSLASSLTSVTISAAVLSYTFSSVVIQVDNV